MWLGVEKTSAVDFGPSVDKNHAQDSAYAPVPQSLQSIMKLNLNLYLMTKAGMYGQKHDFNDKVITSMKMLSYLSSSTL